MFWDDIVLVTELMSKYGLREPLVDLGGLEHPSIADYERTIATGDQGARFLRLKQRPFDHLAPGYQIFNPDRGHPSIEQMPAQYSACFGTVLCLSVLEHVDNPFWVFDALSRVMKDDALLVVSTVFSFPYHPSPVDNWRFSPNCLRMLGESAGLRVLEADWRIQIPADKGIRNSQNGEPQEIRSVYAVYAKDRFEPRAGGPYTLPVPLADDPREPRAIGAKRLATVARSRLRPFKRHTR